MECPSCGSTDYKKCGSFSRRSDGARVQRYQCSECGTRFNPNTAGAVDPLKRAPDGYRVKGVSELVDGEGNIRLQWIKTDQKAADREAALKAMAEAMREEIRPVRPSGGVKRQTSPDLCNVFIVTDYHVGMKAFGEETRQANWDMDIAEQLLVDWIGAAIESAPKASTAVLAQMGDFFHYDSLDAITPTSKHILDSDTRLPLMARVATRLLHHVVQMLLETHDEVHVIIAEGNHDLALSHLLRESFAYYYSEEPRCKVDQDMDGYHCFEWGDVALFFHHGHRRKPANIDTTLVGKPGFREIYGRTKHAYAHLGHLHHQKSLETNLMIVEQHRTLAAADAYAAKAGWNSGRSAPVITYHKQHGEVARFTISPEMVAA